MSRTGALYCLASAAGFGAMGVFGKLAYDEGVTVGTLLSTRFVLAAVVFWLILVCARGGIRELRSLTRRDLLIAIALGAVGYGAQAGAYFAALDRLDASLLALLVYTYPVLVAVAAIAIGREPARRTTAVSLALASTGLVLVLAGAAAGALDALGTALGLNELAAQARRLARERLHRRHREVERDRLERGDASPAGHGAGGRGEVRLGELGPLEQRASVVHEHERGVRQAHAAPRALEQREPGLALEHRELL